MEIVHKALLQSEWSDEEKIIYAIDMLLDDEYGIFDDFDQVQDRHWKKTAWSAVVDRLRKRLADYPVASGDREEWIKSYQRERLSDWVVIVLNNAGRAGEATELCVDESCMSSSYTRAVRRLIEAGDEGHAAALATEGLHALSPRYAGVVGEFQDLLCEIAAKKKDWMLPEAVAADRFFDRPSLSSYCELLLAAKKTEHAEAIQNEAMAFLESGLRPDMGAGSSSSWPLPKVTQPTKQEDKGCSGQSGPYFDVLIELAIDENHPNDVLIWFDRRESARLSAVRQSHGCASRDTAKVAKAVEDTHPERAIDIYERLANAIAAEMNPKTYHQAGAYLKQIRSLLKKSGREGDWARCPRRMRSTRHRYVQRRSWRNAKHWAPLR